MRLPNHDQRSSRLIFTGLTTLGRIGVILALALVGAGWYAHRWLQQFIRTDLRPLVQKTLTDQLQRPVKLGAVEQYSWNGLRFGASEIPPTPTDPDRVTVEAIEVSFNPWDALSPSRKIHLHAKLLRPKAYIEEDSKGVWISTQLKDLPDEGPFKIQLDSAQLQAADITLMPRLEPGQKQRSPYVVQQAQAQLWFHDNNQRVRFQTQGKPTTGGDFKLFGDYFTAQQRFKFQAQGKSLAVPALDHLLHLPWQYLAGKGSGDLDVDFTVNKLPLLKGTANFQAVALKIDDLPQTIRDAQGNLSFQGEQITILKSQGRYGLVPGQLMGTADPKKGLNLLGKVQSVAIADAQRTIDLQLPFPTAGKVGVDFKIAGSYTDPVMSGTVRSMGQMRADLVDLETAQADFQLKGTQVKVENVQSTPVFGGRITGGGTVSLANAGQLNLNFRGEQLPVEAIAKIYAPLPFATTGEIATDVKLTGAFTQPVLTGTLNATQPLLVDRLKLTNAKAKFQAINLVTKVTDIQAQPEIGGRITGNGTLDLNPGGRVDLQLYAQGMPGETLAALYDQQPGIKIGTVAASMAVNVPLPSTPGQAIDANAARTVVDWQAPAALYPARGQATLLADRTLLHNTVLQVEGGEVALNGELMGDRWQADADLSGIRLQPFSPELRGRVSGRLKLTGTTNDVSVAATRAAGTVRLSNGLAVIPDPMTAQVSWQGDRLQVLNAIADGFQGQGTILTQTTTSNVPEVTALDLKVALQNYNLNSLLRETAVTLPSGTTLKGRVTYAGELTGSLDNLRTSGNLELKGLTVNDVAFEPNLTGRFQYQTETGVDFSVKGKTDQVALEADAQNRPVQFLIQRNQATMTAQAEGDLLQVAIRQFPLEMIPVPQPSDPKLEPPVVKGVLAGNFRVDWQKQTGQGQVQIQRPQLGTLMGDRFVGDIRYANNVADLVQGQLQQRQSRYDMAGRFNFAPKGAEPQLQAQVNVRNGNVQDALALVQWFDIEDVSRGFTPPEFAKAADVKPTPIALPDNATVQQQLEGFSEFLAKRQQQVAQQPKSAQLPPLRTLVGQYEGSLGIKGSLNKGIDVTFDLLGDNWKWDTYDLQRVSLKGNWVNEQLTLLPVAIQSGDAAAIFQGSVGSGKQAGDLQLKNIAIADIKRFLNLDLEATGKVNGTAKLGGTWENPTAQGSLAIADGTLKNEPIQSAQAEFKYENARLTFDSRASISQPEPVLIAGSLPLALPFVKAKPANDQIQLNIDVKNEALSLMNILDSPVQWQEGRGQVQVQVQGTLDRPVATGVVTIADASFKSSALPDPLKQVNGTIRFDNELVQVETLTGVYGAGHVSAAGVIPLSNAVARTRQRQPLLPVQPLTVDLNALTVNLPKLYRGGVNGQLVVTGSVPAPILSGDLSLIDGLAFLPEETAPVTPANAPRPKPVSAPTSRRPLAAAVPSNDTVDLGDLEFANLKVSLGDRLRINGPLMNFIAKGDVTLNGTIQEPRPQGTLDLLRGQVNIYTTLFILDRPYRQTATFVPDQGLDPNLNVHMVTSVPEVSRVPLPQSPLESSEIAVQPSTNIGALRTIRIQAIARGPASQIVDNLELKSSPARSSDEILALLGGGFVGALGQGNNTLAIANLAGSAVFTNLQSLINNNVGLVDVRIFPAVVPKDNSRNPAGIDLAGEIGIPLTRNFSASVLASLTSRETLTLFNLRYRVNDVIQLRGATDFVKENQVVVEFDKRF